MQNNFLNYSSIFFNGTMSDTCFGWNSNDPRIYRRFAANFMAFLFDSYAERSCQSEASIDKPQHSSFIREIFSLTSSSLSNSRSGVLLTNGNVYIGPGSKTSALIFNTDNLTLSTPAGSYFGTNGFSSCVLLKDGRVYNIPNLSSYAVIYNPNLNTVFTPSYTFSSPYNGFNHGTLLLDGRVYHCPGSNNFALIYDPLSDTYFTPSGTFPGSNFVRKCLLLPDGNVFLPPFNISILNRPLIYNPTNDTLTTPNITIPADVHDCFHLYGNIIGVVSLMQANNTAVRFINIKTEEISPPSLAEVSVSELSEINIIRSVCGNVIFDFRSVSGYNDFSFHYRLDTKETGIQTSESSNFSPNSPFIYGTELVDGSILTIHGNRLSIYNSNHFDNNKSRIRILTSPFINRG